MSRHRTVFVVAVGIIAATSPTASRASVFMLRGINVISAQHSVRMVVEIPGTAEISLGIEDNPNFVIESAHGTPAAVALVQDPDDPNTPMLIATRLPTGAFCRSTSLPLMSCPSQRITSIWSRYFAVKTPPIPPFPAPDNLPDLEYFEWLMHQPGLDETQIVIPPGSYQMFVLASEPVQVRLRLEGLSGVSELAPTEAVPASVTTTTGRLDPSVGNAYLADASGSFLPGMYGIAWSLSWASDVTHVGGTYEGCGYQDREALPACLGATSRTPQMSGWWWPAIDTLHIFGTVQLPASGNFTQAVSIMTADLLPSNASAMFWLPLTQRSPGTSSYRESYLCGHAEFEPAPELLGKHRWGCAGFVSKTA